MGLDQGCEVPGWWRFDRRGTARREQVRLHAAALFEHDTTPVQVAKTLRVSTKSAYQWHRCWAAGGTAALASTGTGWHPVAAVGRPADPASIDVAPASTAQADKARTTRAWRAPRGSRGSGTWARRSNSPGTSSGATSGCWRSWSRAGGISDDTSVGTVFQAGHRASRTP